jgi:hypothetical protein
MLMKIASTVRGKPPDYGEHPQRGQKYLISFVLHRTMAESPADLNTHHAMKELDNSGTPS